MIEAMTQKALMGYSVLRGYNFTYQFYLLNQLLSKVPGLKGSDFKVADDAADAIRESFIDLFREDTRKMASGEYPIAMLKPRLKLKDIPKAPGLLLDFMKIYRRREIGKTKSFDRDSLKFMDDLPGYYCRNYHFQSNGYLSEKSAELYDYEVALLFGGTGDAMRRLVLEPIRKKYGMTDGKGLKLLEIGTGTGLSTRFLKYLLPKAKVYALDLSQPYLNVARKNLENFDHINFVQGDGAELPFQDGYFDIVTSVFLFHEVPRQEREKILAEAHRVLKKDGLLSLVDSIQTGDWAVGDNVIADFPANYHEPFYAHYIKNPIEDVFKKVGFDDVKKKRGYLSKVVWAEK